MCTQFLDRQSGRRDGQAGLAIGRKGKGTIKLSPEETIEYALQYNRGDIIKTPEGATVIHLKRSLNDGGITIHGLMRRLFEQRIVQEADGIIPVVIFRMDTIDDAVRGKPKGIDEGVVFCRFTGKLSESGIEESGLSSMTGSQALVAWAAL